VLKIVSPEILHKTEAGGVLVGIKSAAEAEKGFATIMANAARYDAKATLLGVQVQQMLAGGQEVIIGRRDRSAFGKLVAFGLGGFCRSAEGHHVPARPASRDDALSMLDGIAAAEILKACAAPIPRPGRARRHDRERLATRRGLPRDRRAGPEPGVRDQERRDCGGRAHRRRFRAGVPRYRPSQETIVSQMTAS